MVNIWIVDDEEPFRVLIKTMLERKGYEVTEVEDGEKCLQLLKNGEYPDLILLDVMMPNIDGWEVCRRIKKNRAISMIPVCILTAKAGAADVHMSLNKVNANWHLNKPIEREHLLDAVEWLTKGSVSKKQ